MYALKDYIKRSVHFSNNLIFSQHKTLSTLMLYVTDKCNSKCLHCNIWEIKPVKHLSLDDIIKIMSSKCISKNTHIGLEGGEFLLHPQATEIMQWFHENHPNFSLLSNGLLPDALKKLVVAYPPCRLYMSFDGAQEGYKKMRGVDGYEKVIKSIELCKDLVPISLMFTLTPFNTLEDLNHVINISKKYDIDVRIGMFSDIELFNVSEVYNDNFKKDKVLAGDSPQLSEELRQAIRNTNENYDYFMLHDEWKNKRLNLRCHSIFDSLVIHPSGDVPLCQRSDAFLGNIHKNTLDEIFNGKEACALQKHRSKNCNGCWINYHRKYDIILVRSMEKLLPRIVIEMMYGKYSWTEPKGMSYKKLMADK